MNDLPYPKDDGDRKVLADVAEFGWHVVLVPADASGPGWGFSIGLQHTFDHPEIMVFGLPMDTMHQIINTVAEQVQSGGSFQAGSTSSEILVGLPCQFESVENNWYPQLLGYARWFYKGDEFPILQCVWPDRHGVFPEDWNRDHELNDLQPRLWFSDPDLARIEVVPESTDS